MILICFICDDCLKERRIMILKQLIKILQQAPQDIDVDVFNHSTDYLQKIDNVWISNEKDMKDNI